MALCATADENQNISSWTGAP